MKRGKERTPETLSIGQTIVRLRERADLSAVELCRRSGSVDPKTLNAIEKGRIKNPSLGSLQGIAKGLGCLVRDLFSEAEIEQESNFFRGSQKGFFHMEFPGQPVKVVSATPPNAPFFCGKLIFGAKRRVDGDLLGHPQSILVEVVMGQLEVSVEDKPVLLKEGENLFFSGSFRYGFRNPLSREATTWLVAYPSLFRV